MKLFYLSSLWDNTVYHPYLTIFQKYTYVRVYLLQTSNVDFDVIDVNVNGTLTALRKAIEWDARFVLASSWIQKRPSHHQHHSSK